MNKTSFYITKTNNPIFINFYKKEIKEKRGLKIPIKK